MPVLSEGVVVVKSQGLSGLNSDFGKARDSLGRFVKQGDTSFAGINRGAGRARRGVKGLLGDLGDASSRLSEIGVRGSGSLSRLSGGLRLAATSATTLAVAATAAGVAVTAIIGVQSVRAAGRLEASMTNVASISDDVRRNMGSLTRTVSDLSVSANVDPNLLSAGFYQTISSGITDTGEALGFLSVSARAARAGLTETSTSVGALAAIVNAFGFASSQAESIADKLFTTVNLGVTTFPELASSIGNIAPIAAQLGISLDEVLGAIAALTLTGKSTSEAVTGIRSALVGVISPTDQAAGLAEELGLEFNAEALAARGLAGFLDDVAVATNGNVTAVNTLFGRVEGFQAVLSLTGKQAGTFASSVDKITNNIGAMNSAFQLQNQTFQALTGRLGNEVTRFFNEIGEVFLPAAKTSVSLLADAVNELTDGIRRLKQESPVDIEIVVPEDLQGRIGSVTVGQTRAETRQEEIEAIRQQGRISFAQFLGESGRFSAFSGTGDAPVLTDANQAVSGPDFLRVDPLRGERRPIQSRLPGFTPEILEQEELLEAAQQAINAQTESAIQLFEDWKLTVEGATASAQSQLDKILVLLEQQGIAVVDNIPLLQQHSAAWRSANRVITPLQVRVKQNIVDSNAELGKLIGTVAKGETDFKGAFQSIGASLKGFIAEGREGFSRQAETFRQFQESITDLELKSEAARLDAAGMGTEARLLLFDAEIDRRKAAIDRDVDNTLAAESLKTSLTRAAAKERANIRLGKAISAPSGFPRTATGQPSFNVGIEETIGRLDIAGAMVSDFVSDTARSFGILDRAIQGGKTGGVTGALVGLGLGIVEQTEAFEDFKTKLGDTLATLVKAFEPIISALLEGLGPALDSIGQILESLAPLLEGLGKALELSLKPFNAVVSVVGDVVSGLTDVVSDLVPGVSPERQEAFADLPEKQRNRANLLLAEELERLNVEFRRAKERGDIAANTPFQVFVDRQGGVKLGNIGPTAPGDKSFGPLGGIKGDSLTAEKEKAQTERSRSRGGITISSITGQTRDVLVSALSPLNQLDTTFPRMLDELRAIRSLLSGTSVNDVNQLFPSLATTTPPVSVLAQVDRAMESRASDMGDMITAPGVPALGNIRGNLSGEPQTTIPAIEIPRFPGEPMISLPNVERATGISTVEDSERQARREGFTSREGVTVLGDLNLSVEQVTDMSQDDIMDQISREFDNERRRLGTRSRAALLQ